MSKPNKSKGAEKPVEETLVVPNPELEADAEKVKVEYVSEAEAAELVGFVADEESRAIEEETAKLQAQMAEIQAQTEAKIAANIEAVKAKKDEAQAFAIEMRKIPVEVSNEIKAVLSEDDAFRDVVTEYAEMKIAREAEIRKANTVLIGLKKDLKERLIRYNIPEDVANKVLRTKGVKTPTGAKGKVAAGDRRKSLVAIKDGKKVPWTEIMKDYGVPAPEGSFSAYREVKSWAKKQGEAYTGVMPCDPDTGEEVEWV